MTESEKLVSEVARAIFGVLNQQAERHPQTDFDSEWANQRGDYLGVTTPSLVDQSKAAAQAAIAILALHPAQPTREG